MDGWTLFQKTKVLLLNRFMKHSFQGVKDFTNNSERILKKITENLQCNYKSQ